MKRLLQVTPVLWFFLFAQLAQADWTPAKRLTWNSGLSIGPAIAVDSSGGLHVVWRDYTPENWEIYYKKSTDGGANWSSTQRITWAAGDSSEPDIAVDISDNLHVVWHESSGEVYYKRSMDGGTSWTSSQRLTRTSGLSNVPDIAVDSSGNLHVVWDDNTPGSVEIYYKKSTDVGTSWTSSQRLTWTSGGSFVPAIGVDSADDLHVVWRDYTPGNYDIYHKSSTDGGDHWTTSRRLTWNSGDSYVRSIGVDSAAGLYIIWNDDSPGNMEIYHKRSTDGGASWGTNQRLTWNSSYSGGPDLAVDASDNIHAVWRDDMSGNMEIYYRKSTDGGAHWTAGRRLTWTSGLTQNPALAVDSSGNIHVVWDNNGSGNAEIYYKKGS